MERINNRSDLIRWIKTDYDQFGMRYPLISRLTFGENWELFRYLKVLRHLEFYSNSKSFVCRHFIKWYYWLKHRRSCKKNLIYVSPNSIGPGCHFVHRGFRHILGSAKIGANCTILPNVLIGKKRPDIDYCDILIGNNCYISTGVTILGPVQIGNNVIIAAGAVVNKDFPDNCIIGGVPAEIIMYNDSLYEKTSD